MKTLAALAFAFVMHNTEAIMPETITLPNKVVLTGKQKRNLKRKSK